MVDHFAHEMPAIRASARRKNLQERAINLSSIVWSMHDKVVVGQRERHPQPYQQEPAPRALLLPHSHEHAECEHAQCGQQLIGDYLIHPTSEDSKRYGD